MRIPTPVPHAAALFSRRAEQKLDIREKLQPIAPKQINNMKRIVLEPQSMPIKIPRPTVFGANPPTSITNRPGAEAGNATTLCEPGSALPNNKSWLFQGPWSRPAWAHRGAPTPGESPAAIARSPAAAENSKAPGVAHVGGKAKLCTLDLFGESPGMGNTRGSPFPAEAFNFALDHRHSIQARSDDAEPPETTRARPQEKPTPPPKPSWLVERANVRRMHVAKPPATAATTPADASRVHGTTSVGNRHPMPTALTHEPKKALPANLLEQIRNASLRTSTPLRTPPPTSTSPLEAILSRVFHEEGFNQTRDGDKDSGNESQAGADDLDGDWAP